MCATFSNRWSCLQTLIQLNDLLFHIALRIFLLEMTLAVEEHWTMKPKPIVLSSFSSSVLWAVKFHKTNRTIGKAQKSKRVSMIWKTPLFPKIFTYLYITHEHIPIKTSTDWERNWTGSCDSGSNSCSAHAPHCLPRCRIASGHTCKEAAWEVQPLALKYSWEPQTSCTAKTANGYYCQAAKQ